MVGMADACHSAGSVHCSGWEGGHAGNRQRDPPRCRVRGGAGGSGAAVGAAAAGHPRGEARCLARSHPPGVSLNCTATGYWRPQPGGQLELILAHPTGIAEIYVGEVSGAKIELRTDVVARTTTA